MKQPEENDGRERAMNRRDFVRRGLFGLAATALGTAGVTSLINGKAQEYVWQIDPEKCVQCGRCETACVLTPSAVKCVHNYDMCGYCRLCGGYHDPQAETTDTAAENQLCPTGAIQRTFVEDPFYEYTIDEDLCIGCGKCVKGCALFGNGSLYLQVRHDRCVNCNVCSIARVCAGDAFRRVPAEDPYILKKT